MKRTWKQTVGKKGSVQSSLCPAPVRRPFKWKYCHASRRGGRLGKVRLRPRRPHVSGCFWIRNFFYPGYQRFFSRAAGIFGVGRRPKPRGAKLTIKTWQKPETALGKSLAPGVQLFLSGFKNFHVHMYPHSNWICPSTRIWMSLNPQIFLLSDRLEWIFMVKN